MATKTKKTTPRKASPTLPAGLPVRAILVPHDLSEFANEALVYAASLARKVGAKITLLHVVERPYYFSEAEVLHTSFGYPRAESFEQISKTSKETLSRICKELKVGPSILDEILVESGVPFNVIVAAATSRNVDLIVLSTHGRTGIAKVLMGSTAERVVRHAIEPVLVVRSRKASKKA